jgi:hypothetical protein
VLLESSEHPRLPRSTALRRPRNGAPPKYQRTLMLLLLLMLSLPLVEVHPSQWRECCSRFCCLELEWPTEWSHETFPRFPFFEEAGVPALPPRQQKSMQMYQCEALATTAVSSSFREERNRR